MGRRKISQKAVKSLVTLEQQSKPLAKHHHNPQALMGNNGAEDMKQLVKDLNLDISDKMIDFVTDPSISQHKSRREKLRQKHASKAIVEYAQATQTLRKSQVKVQKCRDNLMGYEADLVMLNLKAKLLEGLSSTPNESEDANNNDGIKGVENGPNTAMGNKESVHPEKGSKKAGIVNLTDLDLKKGAEADHQENDNTEMETLSDSSQQNSEHTEADDGVDEESSYEDPFINGHYSSVEEHMLPFFHLQEDGGSFDQTITVASRKDHKRIRKEMVKALLSQPELQRSMNKSPLLREMKTLYEETIRRCSDACTKTKGCRCEACKDTHGAVLEIMVGCFLHHFVGIEGVSRTQETEDGKIIPVPYKL